MSAIGGILSLDGDPRNELHPLLRKMAAALSGWGPGDASTAFPDELHDGVVGMLHRPLHGHGGERQCRQPYRAGGLLLAWDGRLDHRRELARRLGLAVGAEPPAEVELVVAAYRRWGDGFAGELLGDFAFSLWDPRRRTLILGRDPFGPRTLFYAAADPGDGGEVVWATGVRGVLAARPELPRELDGGWIAGYLTSRYPLDGTPYRAVRAVPPGCAVIFSGGSQSSRTLRFWPPPELPEVRFRDDREAEERFRELFTDAVRCRLRTDGPVFAELSGGVDSSSIVCVADRLLRDGGAGATGLETVSWVFDAARSCDERRWIAPVEARTGRPAHHLVEDELPLVAGFDAVRFEVPTTLALFHLRHRRMAELMGRAGARVLLSGIGGDSLVWSEYRTPPQLADLAATGRLPRLARELRVWQRETGHPYGKLLRDGVLQQLVPERWRWRLWRGNQVAPWIGRRFARRHRVAELLSRPRVERRRWHRPSREQQFASIREAVHRQVSPNYLEAELMSVEIAYPFLHRPLVEFCLGLPADQFVRPGETRSIHRRALAGALPPEVARRTGKRGPTEAVMRGLAREWPKLSALFSGSARVYDLGIVDRSGFVAALEARRFGRVGDPGPVEKVLGLEVWLRGLDTPAASRRGAAQLDAVAPGLHLETVA